jgi:adenosylcobinamide-phosphate synthase
MVSIAWVLAVGLPVAAVMVCLYLVLVWINPILFGWVLNVLVLYVTMGFPAVQPSLRSDSRSTARRATPTPRDASWATGCQRNTDRMKSEEIARLSIEQGILAAHRHVLAPLALFALLPGPDRSAHLSPDRTAVLGVGTSRKHRIRCFRPLCAPDVRMAGLDPRADDGGDLRHRRRFRGCRALLAHPGSESGRNRRRASCCPVAAARSGSGSGRPCSNWARWPTVRISEWVMKPNVDLMQSAIGLVWRTLVFCLILLGLLTLAGYIGN